MNVNLHVERLVLDGLDAKSCDAQAMSEALQTELARLIGAGEATLSQSWNVPRIRAPSMTLAPGADATAIGAGAARSIYGSLSPAIAPDANAAGAPHAAGDRP